MIRKKWWARGEHCPMVVTVGQAPALGAAAAATSPENVCEFDVAGGRIGRPIKLVKGRVTGVPFPNDCELVYEGFMPSHEELTMKEGPFGEWPGYYTSIGPEPVLQVKAIYHRNDPIQMRDAAGAADLSRHLFRHRRLGADPRRRRCGTISKPPACRASRASGRCRAAARASST